MLAGGLHASGYHVGSKQYAPWDANPRGFFEDINVNRINETLLMQLFPATWENSGRFPPITKWKFLWRWTQPIMDTEVHFSVSRRLKRKMARCTRRHPYCLKDPRFSYTLDAWRDVLEKDAPLYICMFRHPAETVDSLVRLAKNDEFLNAHTPISPEHGFRLWEAIYTHILERHARRGDWLFVEYAQANSPQVHDELERRLGTEIERDFWADELHRSRPSEPVPESVWSVYQELRRRADETCTDE